MLQRICTTEDVWEGEFQEFAVKDIDVIVVHVEGGGFRAFESKCPHQDQSLGEATLEGNVLTCPAHLWQFDVTTGQGVNPAGCKLRGFACSVEGDEVMVDVEQSLEVSGT
ncbi:Rieske 2Fe-2S domain-containing protein [Caballeronia sp. LZ029]|uniref:Rieske 2Fe-2S domain-containing protein n=1 Tax=Caballeronia sp. LZ029 TaxID=3038564 RepID=UPI002864F25B|nr:Rieske 2Fe-2S domain-containing protein [Caballeronia sp. LZ029]MDR5749043.1 Rieske 2Fe-2S domain-containing protein [Caballeronia sp. LZ029]